MIVLALFAALFRAIFPARETFTRRTELHITEALALVESRELAPVASRDSVDALLALAAPAKPHTVDDGLSDVRAELAPLVRQWLAQRDATAACAEPAAWRVIGDPGRSMYSCDDHMVERQDQVGDDSYCVTARERGTCGQSADRRVKVGA